MVNAPSGNKKVKKAANYGGPGGKTTGTTYSNKYGGAGGAQTGNTYKVGAVGVAATPAPRKSSVKPDTDGSGLSRLLNRTSKNLEPIRGLQNPAPQPKAQKPDSVSWQQYLQDALGMTGGSTTDVSNQLAALGGQEGAQRQAASDADAKLKAMYDQLKGSFDADGGTIASQYDTTRDQQAAASDDATNAINNGYQASQDSLTSMLSKLGIGDAAAVAANQGDTLQGDQAQALGTVASNKAASLNNTSAKSASAQDYNRQIGQAAQLEGSTQRAANQQNLAKNLSALAASRAQLQDQASSSSSSGPSLSDAIAYANAASKSDDSSVDAKAKAKQQKLDNALAKEKLALQLNQSNNSAKNSSANALATLMKAGLTQQQAAALLNGKG